MVEYTARNIVTTQLSGVNFSAYIKRRNETSKMLLHEMSFATVVTAFCMINSYKSHS